MTTPDSGASPYRPTVSPDGFDELFAQKATVVRALRRTYPTSCLPDLEDAVLVAFERLWQGWQSVRNPSWAWVFTTATRVYLSTVKTDQRRRRREETWLRQVEHFHVPTQLEQLCVAEEERHLLELLAELPYQQRAALVLQMEGRSYREIAELTNTSEATARSNYRHARKKLATLLNVQKTMTQNNSAGR